MAIENSIQNARVLYELKQYSEAIDMCLNLYEMGIDKREALTIATNSFLWKMTSPYDEKLKDTYFDLMYKAYEETVTIEEVFAMTVEFRTTYVEWQKNLFKYLLNFIEENPTSDNWKTYLDIILKLNSMSIILLGQHSHNSTMQKYREDEELKKEYDRINAETEVPSPLVNTTDIKYAVYETALNIFNNTKALLNENKHGNPEFIKKVVNKTIPELFLSLSMVKYAVLPDDGFGLKERYEQLKSLEMILEYMLVTKVYPNGKSVEIISKDDKLRKKYEEELLVIRKEIKEYELHGKEMEAWREELIEKIVSAQDLNGEIDIEKEQKLWEEKKIEKEKQCEILIQDEISNHEKLCQQIKEKLDSEIKKAKEAREENEKKLKEVTEEKALLNQQKAKLGIFNLSAKKEIDTKLVKLENIYNNLKNKKLPLDSELKKNAEDELSKQKVQHEKNIDVIKAKYVVTISPKEKEERRQAYKHNDENDKKNKEKYSILLILDQAGRLTIKQIETLLKQCFKLCSKSVDICCNDLVDEGLLTQIDNYYFINK